MHGLQAPHIRCHPHTCSLICQSMYNLVNTQQVQNKSCTVACCLGLRQATLQPSVKQSSMLNDAAQVGQRARPTAHHVWARPVTANQHVGLMQPQTAAPAHILELQW